MASDHDSSGPPLMRSDDLFLAGHISSSLLQVEVSAKEIKTLLARQRYNLEKIGDAGKIAELVNRLIKPRGVFRWLKVVDAEDGEGFVKGPGLLEGVRLATGNASLFFNHAELAFVTLYTIGTGVDEAITELNRSGRYLDAYAIDTAALIALEKTGNHFRAIAEVEARHRSLGVSPSLSPGSIEGWPLENQRTLCALLPIAEIDVTLSDVCTLLPFKTVSAVITLSNCFDSTKVGSSCRLYRDRKTCRRKINFE